METKKTILVVEDDKSLLPMITYNIEKNELQEKRKEMLLKMVF